MVSSDFTTGLPTSKAGYDAVTTFVDRLSHRVHFVACNTFDSEDTLATNFPRLFLHNMECQMRVSRVETSKFCSKSGKSC